MNIKKKSSKKIIFISVAFIMLVASYLVCASINNFPPFLNTESVESYPMMDITQTEEDAIRNLRDDPSKKIENNQKDRPESPSVDEKTGLKSVHVLITGVGLSDGEMSVSGFVSDVVEYDGVCEYVFSKGSIEVRKETKTLPSPSSTVCTTLKVPLSDFESGRWSVHIEYKSLNSYGASNERSFNV